MMSRFFVPMLAALFLTTTSVSHADFTELTTNGDFEAGNVSGWEYFPTGSSTFGVTTDAFAGSFAGELFNDTIQSAAVIKQANLGVGTVNPGDLIRIRFAARGEFGIGGVSFAEFFSELDGGGTSAAEILGNAPLALSDQWQQFEFFATAGPDVSGGITLQLTATTGGASGSTALLFVDNVSVVVVPEPSTFCVLAAGLAVVGLRRRRS